MRRRLGLRSSWAASATALALTLTVPARSQDWDPYPPQQQAAPPPAAGPAEAPSQAPAPIGTGSTVDFEIAAVAQYMSAPIRGGTNPFGAGFGGRLGFLFKSVYFGAAVVDYLGGNDVDVSYRALLYGAELGYDLRLASFGATSLRLRPVVGLGVASVYYTDPALAADVVTSASGGSSGGGSDTLTVNALYLQPTVLAMLAGAHNFLALGASMLDIPNITYGGAAAAEWRSYAAHLQLGLVF